MDNVNTQAQRGKGTKAQRHKVSLSDLQISICFHFPLCLSIYKIFVGWVEL